MSTYLVTGGTGFLGEHVVRALVAERHHAVRVLARTRSPLLEDLRAECVRGDVLEGDELDVALRGCGAVFHLAGMVSRDQRYLPFFFPAPDAERFKNSRKEASAEAGTRSISIHQPQAFLSRKSYAIDAQK